MYIYIYIIRIKIHNYGNEFTVIGYHLQIITILPRVSRLKFSSQLGQRRKKCIIRKLHRHREIDSTLEGTTLLIDNIRIDNIF